MLRVSSVFRGQVWLWFRCGCGASVVRGQVWVGFVSDCSAHFSPVCCGRGCSVLLGRADSTTRPCTAPA